MINKKDVQDFIATVRGHLNDLENLIDEVEPGGPVNPPEVNPAPLVQAPPPEPESESEPTPEVVEPTNETPTTGTAIVTDATGSREIPIVSTPVPPENVTGA